MRFLRRVATNICGNTSQSALTTNLPMPPQQIPWGRYHLQNLAQHNCQAGSLQPTQQGINPHQHQAGNEQRLYRQYVIVRASQLATIPQQETFQAHVIAAQNGLISKLPSKDQPKPKQDEIKDNKSLLREIILNSDNTEQDHFIKILLKKNKDGDTIITLAADTKYVTEFDAIISALKNKEISKDKITAILNTPNDTGYTALDIVLSHIKNEPENIIDIEAAKKITNLLLNNGAEFSIKKIPYVEENKDKDITESLNKLINKNTKLNQPQANQEQEEDIHKTIIAAYSNNRVSQGSDSSSEKLKRKLNQNKTPANQEQEEDTQKTIIAAYSKNTASKGSDSSSEKLRLSQAATPIKEKQQPNDVISATEFTKKGYEDMTSKPKHSQPSPPLPQSAEEFTKKGYEVNTSPHQNSPPAPPLLQSAKVPHQFCGRHGEWPRRQQGLYNKVLPNGGHGEWPRRQQGLYNKALPNGMHTLLPYCYYKEKNSECSMFL